MESEQAAATVVQDAAVLIDTAVDKEVAVGETKEGAVEPAVALAGNLDTEKETVEVVIKETVTEDAQAAAVECTKVEGAVSETVNTVIPVDTNTAQSSEAVITVDISNTETAETTKVNDPAEKTEAPTVSSDTEIKNKVLEDSEVTVEVAVAEVDTNDLEEAPQDTNEATEVHTTHEVVVANDVGPEAAVVTAAHHGDTVIVSESVDKVPDVGEKVVEPPTAVTEDEVVEEEPTPIEVVEHHEGKTDGQITAAGTVEESCETAESHEAKLESTEVKVGAPESAEVVVESEAKPADGDKDMESLRKAFDAFDKNSDGEITPEELKSVLESMFKQELTEKQIKKAMKLVDTNKDGVINFEEFLQFHESTKKSVEKQQQVDKSNE